MIIAKQENRLNVARSLQEKPEDFAGGPVVKTLCLHCRGLSSILDGRTEIAHAVGMAKKKKKKKTHQKSEFLIHNPPASKMLAMN